MGVTTNTTFLILLTSWPADYALWSQLLKRPKWRNMSNHYKCLMCNKRIKKKNLPTKIYSFNIANSKGIWTQQIKPIASLQLPLIMILNILLWLKLRRRQSLSLGISKLQPRQKLSLYLVNLRCLSTSSRNWMSD